MLNFPKPLQQGDKIAIISPAGVISKEKVDNGITLLSNWGFDPIVDHRALNVYGRFAGTDLERISAFQDAIDNPDIKAILCSRGGYGLIRIIDQLDFSPLKTLHKWIIGYSDITVVHNHVHTFLGTPTLHATMPTNFATNTSEALQSMEKALTGKQMKVEASANSLNRSGINNGILVGGNLSVLASLIGTSSDIETTGKILFIEEINEELYHIDRMLWTLKKAGKLDNLAGLVIGQFTGILDNPTFGKKLEELVMEKISSQTFPVAFDFPIGHVSNNRAVIIGAKAKLNVNVHDASLIQNDHPIL